MGCSKLFGIWLATGGAIVMIVSSPPNPSSSSTHNSSDSILGYIFLLGNCISMAAYVLIQKKFIFNPAIVQTTTYTTLSTSGTTIITTRDMYPLSRWATTPISMTAYSYMACSLL